MSDKINISIIICTYNRSELLNLCLRSLTEQTVDSSKFGIVVVNNNSNDNTINIAEKFQNCFKNYKIVTEYIQGLSIARNRGYKEAISDWVLYLDDDAKAYPDFIERAIRIIESYKFDCFGGRFHAWYQGKKPRWLSDEFGTNYALKEFGELDVLKNGKYACGGVLAIRKEILEELGGFSVDYGMKGKKMGFGEETLLQYTMSKKGYIIGFDPKLQIDHLVDKKKYSVFWHLKEGYIQGKYNAKVNNQKKCLTVLVDILRVLKNNFFISLKKLFFTKDYFWQNFLFDTVRPVLYRLGKISTILIDKT